MAHAVVVTLMHTLDQILDSNGVSITYEKLQIESLLEKLSSLLEFLEECSQSSSQQVKSLESKIRDVAYWAEDVIEFRIFHSRSESQGTWSSLQERFPTQLQNLVDIDPREDLQKIIAEIDSIMEEVEKIMDLLKNIAEDDTVMEEVEGSSQQNVQLRTILPSRSGSRGRANTVGFLKDLEQIKERLCYGQPKLQIIPIVGMGGIGKTFLAKNVYDDSCVKYHFGIRAWVTVSQQYRTRDVLLSLLSDIIVDSHEIRNEDDGDLEGYLYKNLKGRRYLIVVDDLWSTKAWNHIQRLFPNDNNGSRIILTSRLKDVANHVSSSNTHHQMRFLSEEDGWELFVREVFGELYCPLELVDIGKDIVQNCQGLPLLIVVIGGFLSKLDKKLHDWKFVSANLISIITENNDWCIKILTLSYNYLPPHLKACFLYIGVFPDDYEIPVSRLVKLWVAEGFVKPNKSNCVEEVAEQYLIELIDRNLILVRQKGSIRGKSKSCGMHDLLRELCVRIAHKENFFHVKSKHLRVFAEEKTLSRHLCIHDNSLFSLNEDITPWASSSPHEEDITLQSLSLVRSFIYTGWDETQLHSYYYFGCLLLRVLDMVGLELEVLPDEVDQLVNLRYIAIGSYMSEIPHSITLMRNLQTLIVEDQWGFTVELPEEILGMVQLRHIKISRASLPPAFYIPLEDSDEHSVLSNLQTLSNVQDLGMIKHVFEKIPNVRKLGICYSTTTKSFFDVHLQNLGTLKIIFESPTNSSFLRSVTSAPSLKKITLERGRIDWEDMTILGVLPNLEVLKLREFAFIGPVWKPTEGEFLNLKFLQIWETDLVQWRADDAHFPTLEHLIIWKCLNLEEIPSGIGNIATLKIIEIDDSSPPALQSAKDILEEQHDNGNYDLQIIFHQTKERVHRLKFGIQQDESGSLRRGKTKLDELRKHGSDSDQEDVWDFGLESR